MIDSSAHERRQRIDSAVTFLRTAIPSQPEIALILGTGLGGLANVIESPRSVAYADIPGFPLSTVSGHAGRLVFGRLGEVSVVAMQGRFHLYEGYSPHQVVFGLRVLHALGAQTLIVTNAAGGLRPGLRAGDLMVLTDHIGLPTMAGLNPLLGTNDETLGPRFPAMTHAYDPRLCDLARQAGAALRIPVTGGVYAMVSGPNYETPAELRFLRMAGADAVGMSTVPEVIAARHMNMAVLAISCITNVALGDEPTAPHVPSHLDVVAAGEAAGKRLTALVCAVIRAAVG